MTDDKTNDGSDLSFLQQLETEEVVFVTATGEPHIFIMTSLVPADLTETRKRVARKQVEQDEQELFLCFLALHKCHKHLKWKEFRRINMAAQMKFIAVMFKMNGMNDVFRAINPTADGGNEPSGADIGEIDSDEYDETELTDI